MTTPAYPAISLLLADLAKSVLDLLFPPYCLGCRSEGPVLCEECLAGSQSLVRPFCDLCAHSEVSGARPFCQEEPPPFDAVRARFIFDGAVRQAVHGLKYRGIRSAAPQPGRLLADYATNNKISANVIACGAAPPPPAPQARL